MQQIYNANEIRVDITKKELDNHIEQATVVDEVMSSKFSNE
jgi:Tc toxin complex TcA C-terminal TcB-binding domain